MKILHVADLHFRRGWFDWVASCGRKFELIVIAGDLQDAFSSTSMHEQAKAIRKWLLSLERPTIVCSGNHDFWVGDPRVTKDVFAEGGWLRNLRGQGSIVGVDGALVRRHDVLAAVNGWLQVPDLDEPVDLLVTHAPPSGCACASGAEGRDVGDPDLWPALQEYPPTILLCGHIHTPRAFACSWPPIDPTTRVLVPGCDESAELPNHWVIDTHSRTAKHSLGEVVQYQMD